MATMAFGLFVSASLSVASDAVVEEMKIAQTVLERALWSCKVAGAVTRTDLPVDKSKRPTITRFAWLGKPGSARTDEVGADGYETSCAWTPTFVFRAAG